MRNVLYSEWLDLLATHGPLSMACVRCDSDSSLRWESSTRALILCIELRISGGKSDHMVPVLKTASDRCLAGDALMALCEMEEKRETFRRAMMAWSHLGGVRVWLRDMPCMFCSGTGKSQGGECSRCQGSGVLNEKDAS